MVPRILKRLLYGAVGLGVAGALAAMALTRGPLAPSVVSVAPAKRMSIAPSVFGIGALEARYTFAIGPTQAARVLKVQIDHGDRVKAGQVLVELDPIDLRERLASAEAALARARQAVHTAQAQIREAASRHSLAGANAARYRDLAQKNFVSKEAADVRQNEANVTLAAMEATQSGLMAAERDAERLQAERRALDKQLANLRLVAPAEGIVVGRLAEPGTTVVAGQAVIRLIDPASIWLRARIDQAQAGALQVGQQASVVLRSAQEAALPGRVARIDLQSDSVTEERIVFVEFERPPAKLTIGELAEVTIAQAAIEGALVIPSAAVKRIDQQTGVWRVLAGRARFTPVRIGVRTLDGSSQLLDGLNEGDEVVVHSSALLADSMRVRVNERR